MAASAEEVARLRTSVVRIAVAKKSSNYYQPWSSHHQHHVIGSGCILTNQRILTNAHVVSNALYLEVSKFGDPKRYPARIVCIDHERELALVAVDDAGFWSNTSAGTLGEMPAQHSEVTILGFPVGGNELSMISGVVSRIEMMTYSHSQRFLLAMQTDAAINPGNSGGPAFAAGHLVGIVFQGHGAKDPSLAGDIIPPPVIRAFLDDVADARISGVPDLGVFWQKLQNDALRGHLGIPDDVTGVLVSRVVYESSAYDVLCENDVIIAVDGVPLAGDGSVPIENQLRVHFTHLISLRQVGDTIALDLWRAGERVQRRLVLRPHVALVRLPQPDTKPSYLMAGGLVFTALTHEYISIWGIDKAHFRFLHAYYDCLPSPERSEVVILSEILAHEVNAGYQHMYGVVVEKINHRPITALRDVGPALRHPIDGRHVIEIDNHGRRVETFDQNSAYGRLIVLDAAGAAAATRTLMEQHGMASERSSDLLG